MRLHLSPPRAYLAETSLSERRLPHAHRQFFHEESLIIIVLFLEYSRLKALRENRRKTARGAPLVAVAGGCAPE